ncbi:MAG: hypothetical protein DCF25_05970 [Leptolyngbya foveolarum]|uniref:HNH nuclease domain-containing protein n=1 Tax=Leptolyngbya foveolarum TaxID=47253 RepID=A0A2W4UHZ7_9CYAN|nr:MAG: hypothetical protein DCF25_05970 [Leptolyngbya foveolarum]
MSRKKISEKEIKLLCLRSGGMCAFHNCSQSLVQEGTELDDSVVTGEIAHIVAYESDGPRGDDSFPEEERNKHTNLVLLCRDHHRLVDAQWRTYGVPVLHAMKQAHEEKIRALNKQDTDSPEAMIQDSLHSSLLAVSHLPAFVFSAPTGYGDREDGEVKMALHYPFDKWELTPFILKESRLYTFHDLRKSNNPFRSVSSSSDIQMIPAQELWESAEGKRRYQTLLNRSLYKFTSRLSMQYDPKHYRYFFPAINDTEERSVTYRPPNQRRSDRKVAWPQRRKDTGELKNLWIHLATSLRFHEVAPLQWCLSIRPERHFTSDGKMPLPSKQIGPRSTQLKARMYNDLYLNEVHFWRDYLSSGKPQIILNFGSQSAVVSTAQLLTFDIDWPGVAGDVKPFKNQVYTHDLFSYSELMQVLDGEEEGYEEINDELDEI